MILTWAERHREALEVFDTIPAGRAPGYALDAAGRAARILGDLPRADRYLAEAMEQSPGDRTARVLRILVLTDLQRFEETATGVPIPTRMSGDNATSSFARVLIRPNSPLAQRLGFQIIFGVVGQHADPPPADGLLRAHRGWPGHRATEKCEELASSHAAPMLKCWDLSDGGRVSAFHGVRRRLHRKLLSGRHRRSSAFTRAAHAVRCTAGLPTGRGHVRA